LNTCVCGAVPSGTSSQSIAPVARALISERLRRKWTENEK